MERPNFVIETPVRRQLDSSRYVDSVAGRALISSMTSLHGLVEGCMYVSLNDQRHTDCMQCYRTVCAAL
jgi:hypothetical protein